MEGLWNQQIGKELQELCTCLEFTAGGRMQRRDRL
jgi:hypothetical protein